MRFIDEIRARKKIGHVKPLWVWRTPADMWRDRKHRKEMARELIRAGQRNHSTFIDSLNQIGWSICDCLEDHVVSKMTPGVAEVWWQDRPEITLVSDRTMMAMVAEAVRYGAPNLSPSSYRETNGLYCNYDNTIYIREGTYPCHNGMRYAEWQYTEDVAGHEAGHYVDHAYDLPSVDDPDFIEAYSRERFRLDTYSAADNREYFATCWWICSKYPKIAKYHIPLTYRYFKELLY